MYKKVLTDEERMAELRANLERGNHQLANLKPEKLEEKIERDVKFGFAVPIDKSIVEKIPGAMVQPCGIAVQYGLTKDGEKKLKERLTHDLSFTITDPEASVNSRIDMDEYPAMIYGWCLMRCIHFVVALRLRFPKEPILISKYDLSDAYRRIAHRASSAVQTILVQGMVAYIFLRLSFGGAPNPPVW